MAARHVDVYYKTVAANPKAAVKIRIEALREIQAPSEHFLRELLRSGPPPALMLETAKRLEQLLVEKGKHVATKKAAPDSPQS